MKSVLLLVPAILVLSACQPAQETSVTGAWVRLSAVPANPSAAYFTIAAGPRDTTLTGVSTPAAARSEMHESMKMGGMMSMAPVKLVAVRAGSSVAFAPGGKHVMLFGMKPDVKAGSTITLKLTFASGQSVDTQARVVGPADDAPGQ
ncbi:MAG: copper chaperone PCu(A)C [Pseudomonadota bacterium]